MPNTLVNLARVQSTTIGTGTLTLGSAIAGFNTFAAAGLTDGQTVTYAIEDYSSDTPAAVTGREIGQGVYSAGTLTRGTVYSSTSGGAKINCSGRQHVFITAAAEDFAGSGGLTDGDYGDIVVSGGGTVLSIDSGVATTFGRSLMDDADASAGRTTLGLGTMATETASNYLTTASAASTYQPLDADLTSIAALTTAAYGRSLLETTSEANFKATVNLEIGTDVQAYDAELAAIAGLTSAADRLPYFTGSGTAALATFTAAGRNLVDDADATAQRATLGLVIGTNVQAYDAELAAIAGLTSAADRLPYFTGSGTAALATFTTAGRNLVDDATTADQRTTLGLGTAATQNTGTSGANLPFLNGVNVWSGSSNSFGSGTATGATVNMFNDGDFSAPLGMGSAQASANRGPNFLFRRSSPSPAANDDAGALLFQATDDALADQSYAIIHLRCPSVTAGSITGRIRFQTFSAGTFSIRAAIQAGLIIGAPTGDDKGTGTINAVAVYDDSVLLCAPVEFMKSGTVNTAMWDDYAIDIDEPEDTLTEPVVIDVHLAEPERTIVSNRDGSYQIKDVHTKKASPLEAFPVIDKDGKQVDTVWQPQMKTTVKPARKIVRKNELAHEFKAMLDSGFDPRDPKAYFDKMLADEALPGLKTKANWVPNEESNAKRTNRIILALELQTAAFKTVYEQVEALKAEVESLKKASR